MNKKYRNKTLVCLGDSLTDGDHTGIVTPELAPTQTYWPWLVEAQTGIRCINKGICGDDTTGMLNRIQSNVIDLAPTYCAIMGGANDVFWVDITATGVVENIGKMVNLCRENNIVPIIIIEPIAPYSGSTKSIAVQKTMIDDIRQGSLKYAADNAANCIDLCTTVLYTDTANVYRPVDGVHFQTAGQMIIAENVIAYFDTLIPEIEPEPDAPENYGKKTLTLAYQWSGAEESKRYVEPAGKFASQTVESNALTVKAANATAAGVAWRGKEAVLYDSTSNEIAASLTAKAASATAAGIAWRGTGGGAATVAIWALDGISVSDGVLSLIGDDAQAELDAINGEVV